MKGKQLLEIVDVPGEVPGLLHWHVDPEEGGRAIVLIKPTFCCSQKLVTLAPYFAYQTISPGFVILYRHFDTGLCY